MNDLVSNVVGQPASTESVGVRSDQAEAARAEVRRLAQEFEGLLLAQMLRDMKRSMVDDGASSSEFGAMTDTVDSEFGRALSGAGGFGLSGALLHALDRLVDAAGGPSTPATTGGGVLTAVSTASLAPGSNAADWVDSGAGGAPAAPGPVTSAFGWRRDPITGTPGFHKGVDIGLAYGMDVRAAAEGRVIFAGEQGSYGNVVRVAHPDGRETRYAHLSEQYVHAGDVVTPGQVLGKSGSSGRATGPHLHFELLVNGHPVDPTGGGSD